jgi:SagB-type dehydrogenase family enzyme
MVLHNVGENMLQSYLLSFTEDISVDHPAPDQVVIETSDRRFTLRGLSLGLLLAIQILSSQGATEEELAGQIEERDGVEALSTLYYHLEVFRAHRMLRYSISCGGAHLATLNPISTYFRFTPKPLDPQLSFVLSRFAYLHREEGRMVLESPLSHGKITLHGWMGAALVGGLAGAQSFSSLCDLLSEINPEIIELFLGMLLAAGFLVEAKPEKPCPEESPALLQWDFHDLLFHTRSRLGRHANGFGGTYRFHGKIDPLPAVKPPMSEEGIDLFKPDMERLEERDFPFSLVLEHRRSIREYADRPITDRQLGEFLYRSARVKELIRSEIQDVSRRPCPGGGAIHELELYLTIDSCENIPPGLYHYCPKGHRLERLSSRNELTDALFREAMRSTGQDGRPQVLITIAARFQRLSWKYESIAYSLMLKNVGALYQTMYLVATAMDLAPCALGGGDSDLFARAAGLDYYVETSVGELLLGSKRM